MAAGNEAAYQCHVCAKPYTYLVTCFHKNTHSPYQACQQGKWPDNESQALAVYSCHACACQRKVSSTLSKTERGRERERLQCFPVLPTVYSRSTCTKKVAMRNCELEWQNLLCWALPQYRKTAGSAVRPHTVAKQACRNTGMCTTMLLVHAVANHIYALDKFDC